MGEVTSPEYADQLLKRQTAWWRTTLDLHAPYRWNLNRLKLGRTLDVGCGVGRNLVHLDGIGVDSNASCVAAARKRGLIAFEPRELPPGTFDSLLFSHVLEHVDDPKELVAEYLPRLRPGGQVVLITPQEVGFASDDTHVHFLDLTALERIATDLGLTVERSYSFPFPRLAGKLTKYNEFVVTART